MVSLPTFSVIALNINFGETNAFEIEKCKSKRMGPLYQTHKVYVIVNQVDEFDPLFLQSRDC